MSLKPHTDGLYIAGLGDISASGTVASTLTRAGKGLWALESTATGADTQYYRTTLAQILRIGEAFQYGTFGGPGIGQTKTPFPSKGVGVIDMFAILQLTVEAATSATLRLGQTVFSTVAATAPVQTDILAATTLSSLAVGTEPQVFIVPIPIADQVFNTADLSQIEIELEVVLASTGVLALYGLGAHIAFNYN
jgi:hypothetical protein